MKFATFFITAALALAGTAASPATPATPATPTPPRYETLPDVPPLPVLAQQGHVEHAGARIWYGITGSGSPANLPTNLPANLPANLPVILLHGGRASSLTWAHQARALAAKGRRVILVDSRGHGRSTLGDQPLSYALMAQDVLAVMDRLRLRRADVAGWSDGAIVGLELALRQPRRVGRLFAFGINVNGRYLVPPLDSPVLPLVGPRLRADYEAVAPDPAGFDALSDAVSDMQSREPDYSDAELASLHGPEIAIVGADHDEFITMRHFEYVAAALRDARLVVLRDVSHFAPWQDPARFNRALLRFLGDATDTD